MGNEEDTVRDEVAAAVEHVLTARMGRFGFTRARIRGGEDHDGDDVLFIDAEYAYSKAPVDVRATVGLTSELRDALVALGELRFPHLRHHFDERQLTAKSA